MRTNAMVPIGLKLKYHAPRVAAACLLALLSGCLSLDVNPDEVAVLQGVSGNNQTVQVGATTTEPLVVRAFNTNFEPLEGVEVRWTVTVGSVTLSASTTTTDNSGLSQVTFTPGTTPGGASVRATADGVNVFFTITIVAASG